MRLTPIERVLKNLKGEIPPYMRREFLPKDVAYEQIRQMTGQDFGDDVERWEAWVREQENAGVEFRASTGAIGGTGVSSKTSSFEVVESTWANGRDVVVGRLREGEIENGMTLEAADMPNRWRVLGVSFVPADASAAGLRGFSLERIGHGEPIRPGQILRSVDSFEGR